MKFRKYILNELRMQHPGNAGIPFSVYHIGHDHPPVPTKDSSPAEHLAYAKRLRDEVKRGIAKDGRKLDQEEIMNLQKWAQDHEKMAKTKKEQGKKD